MPIKYKFLAVLFAVPVFVFCQKTLRPIEREKELTKLNWRGIGEEKFSETVTRKFLYFDGAAKTIDLLPAYHYTKRLNGSPQQISVKLSNEIFEPLTSSEIELIKSSDAVSEFIHPKTAISYSRKIPYASVSFVPIRKNKNTGAYEKLVAFKMDIIASGAKKIGPHPVRKWSSNSVLNSGTWYKLGVAEDGIYKISHSFIQNLGIDPAAINPQNFRVYGNGGGMLPYDNSEFRYDDLQENTIYVEGEADGSFDADDYVLFYGQGPHRWEWDAGDNMFHHQLHRYSDTAYYFLTYDLGAGKRIQMQPSENNTNTTVTSFNDFDFYEKEQHNLIKSGREWYGESYGIADKYDFVFAFPNISTNTQVWLKTVAAARTIGATSSFDIEVAGQGTLGSFSINSVIDDYTATYARQNSAIVQFSPTSSAINVSIIMNKGNSSATGWLNYIELNARRQLKMSGDQMLFRDAQSVGGGTAQFQLSNATQQIQIWEVTNPIEVKSQNLILAGNTATFNANVDSLREFVAFTGVEYFTPSSRINVENQNLHALPQADMIIVTNPKFLSYANELADFHREKDELTVNVATTIQVYNEFSSGAQDITAIKDFMKMFYERAASDSTQMPKYLLLFGDGSYDAKNHISGNSNFVPTYQSANSLDPIGSYTSDDYFGLLDDNESENTNDLIDVAIGRLTVRSKQEAQELVSKIKYYYQPQTMSAWRNYIAFVGDDEDNKMHMQQANDLAAIIESNHPVYNIDKIYLDAYQQQVSAGGERYPDASEALDRRMDRGALIVSYTGHGGELGWTHERMLDIPTINSWTNKNNMPAMITATCEFSRYDDPQRTSAGELTLLNPDGGVIGLLTTTRLVFSGDNQKIAEAFFKNAFDTINGEMPRLGDLSMLTKIFGPKNINTRNFTLLGDPAVRLAYPQYNVVTTQLPDTMKALSKVTVKGYVADENNQKMTGFNGILYPTVFDKPATINTLNNDGHGVFTFNVQKNILFKGKASVKNGDFEFTFVVPKDISYTFGNGKISYYAEDGEIDANDYYNGFIIGGTDSTAASDVTGPEVELYMNNEDFVFGGITDENPDLFSKLFDENGFNTTGNGIGHDITAVLDESTSNPIVLNDYFEADLDSYQKGSIRYPFSKLADGKHTLRLKVFDVYNNSGEVETEFIVAKSAQLALDHVLNYPNPFSTNTAFYFEHNMPGHNLDVSIQIFTVSGKLIKSIDMYAMTNGYRVGPIYWDGRDDFGDEIGNGVYLYKVKVIAPTGEQVDKYEKLVILN